MLRRSFCVFVACFFVGCFVASFVGCDAAPVIDVGGEGEGEGESDDDELPAETYCEELAPLFCPFYLRCGRMAVDDDAACREAFAASCEASFEPRFTGLAARGLLSLSRAGLDACAAHLDDVTCDEQFLELSGPCAQIWKGSVSEGGACGLDAESFVCAAGTTCTLDLSFCGVCERVLDDGDACRDVEGSCGPGGSCEDADVCVDRPGVGEACVDGGVPCVLPAQCDSGVCREPAVVDVGAACDRTHRCPYRSVCSDAVCVATAGHGDACDSDDDCDAGFCDGGVCAEFHAVGSACASDTECVVGCVGGVCAGFDAVCTVE